VVWRYFPVIIRVQFHNLMHEIQAASSSSPQGHALAHCAMEVAKARSKIAHLSTLQSQSRSQSTQQQQHPYDFLHMAAVVVVVVVSALLFMILITRFAGFLLCFCFTFLYFTSLTATLTERVF